MRRVGEKIKNKIKIKLKRSVKCTENYLGLLTSMEMHFVSVLFDSSRCHKCCYKEKFSIFFCCFIILDFFICLSVCSHRRRVVKLEIWIDYCSTTMLPLEFRVTCNCGSSFWKCSRICAPPFKSCSKYNRTSITRSSRETYIFEL